jgi:thiol-disulfide isomerase/thioredoxin
MKTLLVSLGLLLATGQSPPLNLSFEDAAGKRITLNERGMLYLVDFWAVGCKPCIEEMPEIDRLARELEPGGRFKLVSVLWGGWRGESLTTFEKRYGVGHGFYSDPDGWIDRLDAKAFPTKLLIRDGVALQRVRGGGEGAYVRWSRIVAKELAPASPPPVEDR